MKTIVTFSRHGGRELRSGTVCHVMIFKPISLGRSLLPAGTRYTFCLANCQTLRRVVEVTAVKCVDVERQSNDKKIT